MNPDLTYFDVLGQRVYSILTPEGWIHVTSDKHVFDHALDAVHYLKGLENPVVEAMREQAEEQEES